jgi:HK97 family phage major capsid protein
MAYNDLTGRTDASPLIPEEVSQEIMQNATEQSAALRLFRRVTMSRKQQRMPVLSALPMAYFVNGDTGLKQTTKMAWENKFLNVEPIAVIVPIPEDVVADADFDMWGEIRPRLEEAIARALDAAIFFGANKPASWPSDIVTAAVAAGNHRNRDVTPDAALGGLFNDMSELFHLVEEDGYDVTDILSRSAMRYYIRNARDTTGQPLQDAQNGTVFGQQIGYGLKGLWPSAAGAGTFGIDAVVGDFSQGIIGVRQDLEYKVLDQAVITDNTGAVQMNLPQQDAVALRVHARFAFQVANPINWEQTNAALRFPFGALRTPGA